MKTTLTLVTPSMARDWLALNTNNRKLRIGAVDEFRIAWERGEWKTTHQGIAFSKNKQLLDGQHRLTFISQLPEDSVVPMNVSADCENDLFGAIDQGKPRSLSDVSGLSQGLVAVGRMFAKIWNSSSTAGLTAQFVMPFIEWATPEYEELITFSPGLSKIWSSAAVRSAAIYQIKQGHDADFVKIAYDSLVRVDIDAMPHAAKALMQQRMSGKIVSARSLDLFCRSLRAFDSTRTQKIRSILVLDQAATIAEVRDVIAHLGKKGPVSAGPTVAKPAANSKARR